MARTASRGRARPKSRPRKRSATRIERGDVPFAKEASLFASVSAMLIIGAFVAKGLIAALTALLRQIA